MTLAGPVEGKTPDSAVASSISSFTVYYTDETQDDYATVGTGSSRAIVNCPKTLNYIRNKPGPDGLALNVYTYSENGTTTGGT